jgi:hypothetical protein
MELTDILVLLFIVACFAAFMTSLAWASRPPRRSGKQSAKSLTARLPGQSGSYSVSH